MIASYLTLANATKLCPGRPSANAVWRWCRRGVRSRTGQIVRLDHIRVGGRIFTTEDALHRFFAAVSEADAPYFARPVPRLNELPEASTLGNIDQRLASANQALGDAGF